MNFDELNCSTPIPSLEEIEQYQNEPDAEKRLSMCFEYQIPKEHMVFDDYDRVMDNISQALTEEYEK